VLDAASFADAPVQWGAVLGASLAGAFIDLRYRKLPNALTVPLFLAGVGYWAWTAGFAGVGQSLLAAVVLMVPFVVLFVLAGGGAGDAKMMGAVGAWLGLQTGLAALVAVMISGIALGFAWAAAHRRAGSVMRNLASMVVVFGGSVAARQGVLAAGKAATPREGMTAMPYGIAIFVGLCAAVGVSTL
jgi:prepilin peptidase CpaA